MNAQVELPLARDKAKLSRTKFAKSLGDRRQMAIAKWKDALVVVLICDRIEEVIFLFFLRAL
jgi:hypothetical protein